MKIRIKRFDKTLPLPPQDKQAAGFDFYCRKSSIIQPGKISPVAINNAIEIPPGHFLILASRSSTSWKKGLILANGIGIIDPFYSGNQDEMKILLLNITNKPVEIKKGELLVQGILIKNESIEWSEVDTFGSAGHGGYKIEPNHNKDIIQK